MRKIRLIYRVLMFLGGLIIWFVIAWQINSSYSDAIERSENLQGLWIASSIVTVFLVVIFFPKAKKEG